MTTLFKLDKIENGEAMLFSLDRAGLKSSLLNLKNESKIFKCASLRTSHIPSTRSRL